MRTHRRAVLILLLIAALVLVLHPAMAKDGHKDGIVTVKIRPLGDLEAGAEYCFDLQGEDQCHWMHPILRTP